MTNQLTLLFLVVVISGALCTVEDYVIMSQCAHNKAIYLAAEGTVSVTDISQTQNITIVGRPDFVNNNFKIALYAKETQRYLCFNDHWKLVGMKELQDTCYFNEAIVHGYFVFRSVVDLQRRIGFTQRGRAVGPKKTVNDACYMFTKIPTDQFFHQHNHYSSTLLAPKSTKTPRPEHSGSSSHLGRGSGAGSGGGRPKANRHRTTQQHRSEEAELGGKTHNKKPKTHGGNRKRQHQQRLQQMRGGGGGGGGSGHSSSDPKNSTYLNSSRQNVELSQYGGHNNHTGKHHNNNHSQPQAHHQPRHHHTSEARRHHHDAKQKAAHHRARLTSTSPETTTSTTATPLTSEQTAVTSTKLKLVSHTDYADIKPTSVVQAATTVAASATTSTSRDVLGSTVAHKRKGRRRKPHRKHTLHKSEQQHEGGHSRHGHSHATMPAYDDEEYMTTDFTTWINSEVSPLASLASVKPTSASLPTWETWYPSVSPTLAEESSDYSSTAVPLYEKKEETKELEASAASFAPTLEANPLPSMPLPLPTSPAYSTSLSVDNINGVISPVAVADSTTTTTTTAATTNTSTFQESEAWLKRHHEKELGSSRKHSLSQALGDEVNVTAEEFENVTATAASSGDSDDFEVSESITELNALAMEGTELTAAEDRNEDLMTTGWASTKSTESHEPTAQTHAAAESEDSASSNAMTDYIYGNRANHKVSRHRHNGDHGAVNAKHQHNNGAGAGQRLHHTKKTAATMAREAAAAAVTSTVSTTTTLAASEGLLEANPSLNYQQALRLDALLTADKNFNAKHSHNTVTDPEATYAPSFSSTAASSSSSSTSASSPAAATTTRKTLRKSTQRLLATPFHQLTYVRNEAGDIDIDSLDNISIYPDLLDNDNVNDGDGDDIHKSGPGGSSRFTMISGYLPTSATATLPESIRIAKIKINRERKRMLRLRNIGGYNA